MLIYIYVYVYVQECTSPHTLEQMGILSVRMWQMPISNMINNMSKYCNGQYLMCNICFVLNYVVRKKVQTNEIRVDNVPLYAS